MVVFNFMESRCRCRDGREAYKSLKFFGQLFVKGETRAATPQKVRRFAKLIASDQLPDEVEIHAVTLLKSGEKTLQDSLAEVCRRLAMFAKLGVTQIDKWNCRVRSRSRLKHVIFIRSEVQAVEAGGAKARLQIKDDWTACWLLLDPSDVRAALRTEGRGRNHLTLPLLSRRKYGLISRVDIKSGSVRTGPANRVPTVGTTVERRKPDVPLEERKSAHGEVARTR